MAVEHTGKGVRAKSVFVMGREDPHLDLFMELLLLIIELGETSKFTTESHKLLQGDVGELFL